MATPSTSAPAPASSSAFPLAAAVRFPRASSSITRASALAQRRRTRLRLRLPEGVGGDLSASAGAVEKGLPLAFPEQPSERARAADSIYDMAAAELSPRPRSLHGLVAAHVLTGNAGGAEMFVSLIRDFAKKGLATRGMEILSAMARYKYDIHMAWLILVGMYIGRQSIKRQADMFHPAKIEEAFSNSTDKDDMKINRKLLLQLCTLPCCTMAWLSFAQTAQSSEGTNMNMVYEVGELFELGIQLSYLLILLGLLGAGTFFVIRQVLVRRELDLSAKELQEQVRSGDASATEYFELGAVMLRRKFYPAAIKYLQQAIQKWDRDEQDLAQVYNALGVSYKRDNKLDKAIQQFQKAVELQPGYVTAWNNLGDAYEQKKDLKSALKAFEEVLLFDPNNTVARPRRDDLKQRASMYKGVAVKSQKS